MLRAGYAGQRIALADKVGEVEKRQMAMKEALRGSTVSLRLYHFNLVIKVSFRLGERPVLRAGYMGHVTALANKMGEVGTRRAAVTEALRGSRAWATWLQRVLRPRNELENVMRWACGRPSAADLAGADSDENELAVR